jgi:hypothetical protein
MTPKEFRSARLELGLSPEEMARLLGCTRRSVDRFETGDRAISRQIELLVYLMQICPPVFRHLDDAATDKEGRGG